MKFTQELYISAKDIWDTYYTHPFVDELGKGSLSKEKFKFYIIQDYLYLLEYAKLFALGVIKSKSEYDMKQFANLTDGILNSEMGIHKVYMEKLNITTKDIANHRPTLDNTSYTSYMLAVSHSGDIKEIAVAALSCMWSYKMIGDKLNEIYGCDHEFYGEWIKTYSSERYSSLNDWNLELVEKHTEYISEDDRAHLINIFRNCSIYEYKFWDMSYKGA